MYLLKTTHNFGQGSAFHYEPTIENCTGKILINTPRYYLSGNSSSTKPLIYQIEYISAIHETESRETYSGIEQLRSYGNLQPYSAVTII